MLHVLFAQGFAPRPAPAPPPPPPDPTAFLVMMGVFLLFAAVLAVVMIVSMWKVFEKAGQPGWAAIIPYYNMYVLTCEVCKKEILWFILQFVPFVGLAAQVVVMLELATRFRKGPGFGIGLILLPFVFMPILAFGDAEYDAPPRPKRRRRYEDEDEDEEDDDYDDRPKRRRRRDEDDD